MSSMAPHSLPLLTFFCLFAVNILNLEASFDQVRQNMEPTITSLRLHVRQGRCTTCCVDLLEDLAGKLELSWCPYSNDVGWMLRFVEIKCFLIMARLCLVCLDSVL